MKKERKSNQFIPKATYPGGNRRMGSFIQENLKYPKEALEDKIEGVVRLKIEIDYKGRVISSQVLSGLSAACNQEAKRVAALLQFEIDQKLRKGKIRFNKTLNIRFKLPKQKPKAKAQPQKTTIKYHITSTSSPNSTTSSQKTSYSYTIKY